MKRLKYIIGLLLVATTTASAAPITVKATMDSTTILIGEQRIIHLEVEQPKIVTLLFPDFKENNILANGVEVLRTSRKDTTVIKGGNLRIKEDLIVTSFDKRLKKDEAAIRRKVKEVFAKQVQQVLFTEA
jgi:hypothetical protein